MPTQSFSARVLDAGAALRVPRPAWAMHGPARPRRLAPLLVVGLVGLLALVYLALRLTPLSAVHRVTVVGAQGPDAPAIRHAIEQAAVGQSTLGFDDGAVRRAVARTPSITGVSVHPKFPHGVQIEVRQRLAVGAIETGGKRVAVSADGHLLPDWDVGSLPVIRGAQRARGSVVGRARAATTVLGSAPQALLGRIARVDGGTTVRFADGPALLFHDTRRLAARWAAAVAVLNDPATRGATWIDLRIPEQPVAGSGAPPALPREDAKVGRSPSPAGGPADPSGAAAPDPTVAGTAGPGGRTATGGDPAPVASAPAGNGSSLPASGGSVTATGSDTAVGRSPTQADPVIPGSATTGAGGTSAQPAPPNAADPTAPTEP